ncbi:protein Mis18-beta [Nerophis lumbriciformis]|uniref:protein Mis18-beta n=1 Tax=Nerophis lumbriciformis TaxID=546530 RepID=UPI002ADFBB91|nr:protein Mis18-beta-like [Nerophis lumbriciformis]
MMEFSDSVLIDRSDEANVESDKESQRLASLHCKQCNTVLADSFSVCGEIKCLDAIAFLRVSDDVIVSSAMECGDKGDIADCIFSSVRCRECGMMAGKVLHAAPPHLADLRSLFLLHKAKLRCYVLDSSAMVEASSVSFDVVPLGEDLHKLRAEFESLSDQMTQVQATRRKAEKSATSEKSSNYFH